MFGSVVVILQGKPLPDLPDFFADMSAQLCVQIGAQFIQQQHLCFRNNSPRHGDTMSLAADQVTDYPRMSLGDPMTI
jgi:hypothetical protein